MREKMSPSQFIGKCEWEGGGLEEMCYGNLMINEKKPDLLKEVESWKYWSDGTWSLETEEVKIYCSFYRHTAFENNFIAPVRWEYKGKSFGTHLKYHLATDNSDDLVPLVGMSIQEWIQNYDKGVSPQEALKPVKPEESDDDSDSSRSEIEASES